MAFFLPQNNLLKIPLLVATLVASHVTVTAPTPPPQNNERKKFGQKMDPVTKMIQMGATRVMDLGVASAAICEIVTILTSHFPLPYTRSASAGLHLVNSGSSNIRLTNTLLVATLLTVAGGIGRSVCYRKLGRHFTYQLAIREEHSLVTDGPYAIVRHPSYLAYIVWAVGATAWMWASGSWVRECGVLDTWLGMVVVGAWTMIVLSVAALVFSRAKLEDETLRKEMREQWDAYAKRTPYTIIPHIF